MKNIITTIALACIVSIGAKAQGDLQFNKVINYQLSINTPLAFTVPSGKVWKIVSAGADAYNSPIIYLRNSGGEPISALYNESTSYNAVLPYWLSESFSGQFYLSNYSSSHKGSVSIIEFNVVP